MKFREVFAGVCMPRGAKDESRMIQQHLAGLDRHCFAKQLAPERPPLLQQCLSSLVPTEPSRLHDKQSRVRGREESLGVSLELAVDSQHDAKLV